MTTQSLFRAISFGTRRFIFLRFCTVMVFAIALLAHGSAFPGKNGKVVYRSFDMVGLDGSYHLHSINPDGTADQDLTPNTPGIPLNNSNEPAVSPDGTKLAFSSDRDHGFNLQNEIYVMNMDGTGVQRLTLSAEGASQPTWSADGKKIAFAQGNTISVINADGTGQAVAFTDPNFRLPNPQPSWSPDGTMIAFSAIGPDSVGRIYLVNSDGSGVHAITSGQDSAPTWSPDGTKLAFTSVRNSGGEIFTVTPGGVESGPIVKISDGGGANPGWSPEGGKIVLEGNDPSGSPHGIFVYDIAGGTRTAVITGQVSQPTWGPAPAPTNVIPPTTTASLSPLPNGYGWNTSNVIVTLTATDNGSSSGVQKITFTATGAQVIPSTSVNGGTAQVLISAEGSTTISYFATDTAGNTETPHTVIVNIDKTAPTVIASPTPAPNLNGWNNTDVTVTFNASDALSGIASVSSPVVLKNEGRGQIVNGGAADRAGNTGQAGVTLNIDKTPPEGSLRFDPSTLQPVLSGRDSLSGVDMDVAPQVVGSVPGLINGQLIKYTVLDLAGNTVVILAQVGGLSLPAQLLPGSQNTVLRIQSIQYNGGPQIAVPSIDLFIQKTKSDLYQSITYYTGSFQQVSAFYLNATNTTEITKVQRDATGKLSVQATTVPGMVLLRLSTNNGQLAGEF